jgi:hypothetical protein
VQRNATGNLRVSLSYELPAISSWLIALDEWGTKGVEDGAYCRKHPSQVGDLTLHIVRLT